MFTGSTIGIHTQRRATSSRVDVRPGEDGAGSGIPTEILAHGMIAINSAGLDYANRCSENKPALLHEKFTVLSGDDFFSSQIANCQVFIITSF